MKTKLFLLIATIVVLALSLKALVMKPLPSVQVEADYKIVVSNTGYLIYNDTILVGYVDYTDTDKLSNVIIKDNK